MLASIVCSKGIYDLCDLKSILVFFFRVLNRYGSSIEGSFNHIVSLLCANNFDLWYRWIRQKREDIQRGKTITSTC